MSSQNNPKTPKTPKASRGRRKVILREGQNIAMSPYSMKLHQDAVARKFEQACDVYDRLLSLCLKTEDDSLSGYDLPLEEIRTLDARVIELKGLAATAYYHKEMSREEYRECDRRLHGEKSKFWYIPPIEGSAVMIAAMPIIIRN